MKLKKLVYFDSKTESYGVPTYHPHRGDMDRFIRRLVNDKSERNDIAKYPADFTFFEIGEYDLQTGIETQYDAKFNLGCAIEFIEKENAEVLTTH